VGLTRARERLILTSASRRRVFGEYKSTEPSRFLDEIPAELIRRIEPAVAPSWNNARYENRNPYQRRFGASKAKEAAPFPDYEDEDQSSGSGLRVGLRVRHKQFGVGTVVAVEEQGDDTRVTVKFNAVGTKKLVARYAALEKA
jgi:DNA helicase-2/ATP-dependent DNA helicase PcrA